MNDINKVLKLFSNKFNMDYCENFDKIKAVMEYCNEHVKTFSKLQFRGGNEEIIQTIVERLEKHLKGRNYASNEQELRKITFFLVLNTDAVYKYDLKSDEHISHVLDVLPKLPKFLLVTLIWDLKLDQSFYEMLSYTPNWFSLQFVEPAVGSIKYLEPYDVLIKVENLVKSIYMSICRSDYRTSDITRKIILNKLHDHTMDLLRQFYTPDTVKFSDWSRREFFKYMGFATKHLLDLVLFVFDNFEHPVTKKLEEKYRIYEICQTASPLVTENMNSYSELVENNLQKIIVALLNSLQYNVMLVTIDVFMHWAEIDLTDDLTLQADIGDSAYQVLERMSRNNKFKHDIAQQLKSIAIRRKTLEETVIEANIGEILRKIEDPHTSDKDRTVWFYELFERPIIFGNEECLETIKNYYYLINIDCCMKLIDLAKGDVDDMKMEDIMEDIIPTVIKSLNNFKCDQLIELIAYELELFGPHVSFEQENFHERCTEFFNKCTEDFDTKRFLQLCFENPEFMWKKFIEEACKSQQQVKNFSNTLIKTSKFSKIYIKSLLNRTFSTSFDAKFYPHFIFEVYESKILMTEKFFKSFVYKNVVCSMEADHLPPLLAMLKALLMITQKSGTPSPFGSVTPPVLVMVGQIMEKCRWDLVSYSDLNDEIVRLSADVIQHASKPFLPIASESDKKWIRDKVKDFRSLTKYYFQKFSLKANETPQTFDKFLHPKDFTNESEIERFLIVNYVRCTTKETEWLAKSDVLRPHITGTILSVEQIVTDLGENTLKNFRHCIVNYENIIKKFLIPSMTSTREDLQGLGFKILKIIKNAPKSLYDEIFMNLYGTLLDVFHAVIPIEEDVHSEVRKYLSTMESCKGKDIFSEKFQAMATENSN